MVVLVLIELVPTAIVDEAVVTREESIELRTRPVVGRLQVRAADAAEAVAQVGVAACCGNHIVPLFLGGQLPCAASERRCVCGASRYGRTPVHLALVGQRECQAARAADFLFHPRLGIIEKILY